MQNKDNYNVVAVPADKLKEMQNELLFLEALRANGVDSWSGYDEAVEMYQEMKSNVQ